MVHVVCLSRLIDVLSITSTWLQCRRQCLCLLTFNVDGPISKVMGALGFLNLTWVTTTPRTLHVCVTVDTSEH